MLPRMIFDARLQMTLLEFTKL